MGFIQVGQTSRRGNRISVGDILDNVELTPWQKAHQIWRRLDVGIQQEREAEEMFLVLDKPKKEGDK